MTPPRAELHDELTAVEAERARRVPARRFILAGATATPAEQAEIDRFRAEYPDSLVIVRSIFKT